MASENLSSVHRALDVLRVLGQGPMGVQDVASAVGREKTQVSRTLKVLAQEGFVERDARSLRYSLGWQVLALATSASQDRLQREAPGVLRALVRRVGEPAYLTVLSGQGAMTLLTERTSRGIQANEWVGRTSPLSCTSAGRALMFGLDEPHVRSLLEGSGSPLPGTVSSPRDVSAVLLRLRSERGKGYSVAIEESEPGLVAVAAPVYDHRGEVVAAVNVSAPAFRMPSEIIPQAADSVIAAADELSSLIGAAPATRDRS
ncbi:IclR family transcriptional regulator [Rothia uropygialis]|uniref:IclR family transcriptional regulator n=1 Tax=Kocuria sp. 36 TaxID=1415402 RepID=UPI00101E0B15|nr:IclR family transcriptional regulator [Kocuria sp. 36]